MSNRTRILVLLALVVGLAFAGACQPTPMPHRPDLPSFPPTAPTPPCADVNDPACAGPISNG